jgi:hypothetical protein
MPRQTSRGLFIDPNPLAGFAREFDSKEALAQWCMDNYTIPQKQFFGAQDTINYVNQSAIDRTHDLYAHWYYDLGPDDPIPAIRRIDVVVVGGATNIRWHITNCSPGTTVKVDDWK